MTDPHDDALRDALRAEVEGVEAGPDLLARVREAKRPASGRRPLLLAVAAAAVAVGVIAVGLARDGRDDESLRIVDTPDRTTSTTTGVDPGTCSPVGNPPCGIAEFGTGPRPNLVALVREDGWLVTVDLDTGEQHELFEGGRPEDRDPETSMSYYIESVELSPDGEWVYYQSCCEPAGGQPYRVRSDGSSTEPEPLMTGYHPRFRPDGGAVATWVGSMGLHVYDTDGGVISTPGGIGDPTPDWVNESTTDISWSPDGTMVALATQLPDDPDQHRVRYFAADGNGVTELAYGNEEQPDTRRFPIWGRIDHTTGEVGYGPVFRDDLGDAAWISQDRTYSWLLWVAQDGTLSFTPTSGADRTELPDLPKARLADW